MNSNSSVLTQGTKYAWRLPNYQKEVIESIAVQYNLSFPVAQILVNRGFETEQSLHDYLFSDQQKEVFDPGQMKDAHKAVDRILQGIQKQEPMLVFGDYDVDGITSSALMMIALIPLGAKVNFFLPNRVRDGYGLSQKVVERAVRNGYRLIITVDNGITAFDPVARANELGIDVIITDHHQPHDHIPDAYAVVNPHQSDCGYPFKHFAGVGVIFKIMSLLYEKLGKPLPHKVYELLLLGTIADVVPLTGENRFWVRHGLHYIKQCESYSLQVLKRNGKVSKPVISSTDIGFSITPQINALGRLEDPRQGVNFLIGSDQKQVEEVGRILIELNEKRKDIEKNILSQIQKDIQAGLIDVVNDRVIIAAQAGWPAGVIGLVASRIVGMYGRPVILLHLTNDGLAKGSCRSIPEFNMFQGLEKVRDLIIQFGGHAMAAGLSLKAENIPLLKARLQEILLRELTEDDLRLKIRIDAQLPLSDVGSKLVHDLEYLEPFGNQNESPLFLVSNVTIMGAVQLLKEAHVKMLVFADGILKPVVFFGRPELYEWLQAREDKVFSLVARVSQNHWQGRVTVELIGVDIQEVV